MEQACAMEVFIPPKGQPVIKFKGPWSRTKIDQVYKYMYRELKHYKKEMATKMLNEQKAIEEAQEGADNG